MFPVWLPSVKLGSSALSSSFFVTSSSLETLRSSEIFDTRLLPSLLASPSPKLMFPVWFPSVKLGSSALSSRFFVPSSSLETLRSSEISSSAAMWGTFSTIEGRLPTKASAFPSVTLSAVAYSSMDSTAIGCNLSVEAPHPSNAFSCKISRCLVSKCWKSFAAHSPFLSANESGDSTDHSIISLETSSLTG